MWRPALVRAGLLGRVEELGADKWRATWPDGTGAEWSAEFTIERDAIAHVALKAAGGLRFHDLRHSYATWLELGTPSKLMDHQMGHADGSIQAVYSHVTTGMRQRLMDGLTEVWEAALATRRTMAPGSPVAVLDRLLRKAD